MTIHLSILLFFPLALGALGGAGAARAGAGARSSARSCRSRYAVVCCSSTSTAAPGGLQYVTDDDWISELGIRYKLGVDGLNLWLVALTALLFAAAALWLTLRPPATGRGCSRSTSGWPRPPCSARSWPRT